MEVSSNELYERCLGKGVFGSVFQYQNKAIKQYHERLYKYDSKNPCLRLNRKKFKLMNIRKPKIKYTFLVEELFYINGKFSGVIYPYIEGEHLGKILTNLSATEKYDLSKQIIRNARELTDNKIYPKDYRLPNILRDTEGNIRIIDLDDIHTHVSLCSNPLQLALSLSSLKSLLINFLEDDDYFVTSKIKGLEKYKETLKLNKKLLVNYETLDQYIDTKLKPFTTIFINVDDIYLLQDLDLEMINQITTHGNCQIVLLGYTPQHTIANQFIEENIPLYDNFVAQEDIDDAIEDYLNKHNITNHLIFDGGLLTKDNSNLDTDIVKKSIEHLSKEKPKTKKLIRAKNL